MDRFESKAPEQTHTHRRFPLLMVSLRLVDSELRGSFTTDESSKISRAEKPRLGDIHLVRVSADKQDATASSTKTAEQALIQKSLEFLDDNPQLRGLSIGMALEDFESLLDKNELKVVGVNHMGTSQTYFIETTRGDKLALSFVKGKCIAIQGPSPKPADRSSNRSSTF